MTTPRKHWFRVADSILYEGWDDNQIATMIRLGAYLNTRWAREGRTHDEACRATLDPADLAKITGKRRRDVALKSLQRLANVTGMSLESRGEVTDIIWPKWSIFQELKPLKPPPECPAHAPSANAPANAPANAKEERRKESPASRSPGVLVRAAWDGMRAEAQSAGMAWPVEPGSEQAKSIKTRLKKYTAEQLAAAVRGYANRHPGLRPSGDFDPRKYFTAESIIRPKNIDANIQFSETPLEHIEPESPAQARQRRTREAARDAFLEDIGAEESPGQKHFEAELRALKGGAG